MKRIARPLLALSAGLAAGLLITWCAGENPLHVAAILYRSAFGSRYDLGMTVFYATPLVFTGISVAIAFQAGLFNIGAEGQLTLGSLSAAAVGALWKSCPAWMAPAVGILAMVSAGALWGAIPGWLRARRGGHEVINTIMLNFIASAFASYVTLYLLKNPASQNPETRPIASSYAIGHIGFFGEAPVSAASIAALLMLLLFWLFLSRTRLGFEFRVVGQSEAVARAAGINADRIRIFAMAMAGGAAGLVGLAEVLGNAGKLRIGFSPDYGFIGIAVALLGRNRPLGILAAALLFGALHKGTANLDLETDHVTRELSLVLQALILLSVSAERLWNWLTREKP